MRRPTIVSLEADIFAKFNAEGSKASVLTSGYPPLDLGIIDNWKVLRIAPRAGDSGGVDFWAVWRNIRFIGMMQYVHVTHFTGYQKTFDNLLLSQTDGSVLQVDFLTPGEEHGWWTDWQQEKTQSPDYQSYFASCGPEIAQMADGI